MRELVERISVNVGIDEDTALVGGPYEWTVQGRQSVWELGEGKRVVCLLPDTGRGYLSKVFNPEWLLEKGMISADEARELSPNAAHELLEAAGVSL